MAGATRRDLSQPAGKMPGMQADDAAARAAQRDLVRRGYDAISVAYRSDDGRAAACSAEDVSRNAGWATELASLLPAGAVVADLGCGIGLPATRALTDQQDLFPASAAGCAQAAIWPHCMTIRSVAHALEPFRLWSQWAGTMFTCIAFSAPMIPW